MKPKPLFSKPLIASAFLSNPAAIPKIVVDLGKINDTFSKLITRFFMLKFC
jgi:hypothetical protein